MNCWILLRYCARCSYICDVNLDWKGKGWFNGIFNGIWNFIFGGACVLHDWFLQICVFYLHRVWAGNFRAGSGDADLAARQAQHPGGNQLSDIYIVWITT